MRVARILLIHGWAVWVGYGTYLWVSGETLAPLRWVIALVVLVVSTGAYMFFNGVEAT